MKGGHSAASGYTSSMAAFSTMTRISKNYTFPIRFFCQHLQGSNEASLYASKETLLYLCASYNYASDLGSNNGIDAFDRDPAKALGLYTLGRIFEQSITELEILEAEADGRPSVNKLSK